MVDFDLHDQVALVTGGTKGIGYGIVRQLLAAGARVAFTSRTAPDCAAVAAALEDEFGPGRVLGLASDLSDRSQLGSLVETVVDRVGPIDTLVANAALTGGHGPPEDAPLDHFDAMLGTNVVSNFELARTVAPAMLERGYGSITFVTSIAAVTAMPTNVAYASAKAGLTSLALSLAGAYAGRGVRVNCVQPGLIRSFSSSAAFADDEQLTAYGRVNIPLGRVGEPEDVGAACVFLASSAGAYITAAVIPVDGGRAALGQIAARPTT